MKPRLRRYANLIIICTWIGILSLFSAGIGSDRASADPAFIVDEALSSKVQLQNGAALDAGTPRPMAERPMKSTTQTHTVRAVGSAQDRITALKAKMNAGGESPHQVTPAQRENLMRLIDTAPDPQAVRVTFDQANGTPTLLKVKAFTKSNGHSRQSFVSLSDAVARQFLRSHRQLLKLNDPDGELALADAWSDAQGGSHFRYRQMINHIPVYGKQLLVHVDGSDEVYLANGRFEPTARTFSTEPAIEPSEALAAVRAHLGLSDLAADSTELVVYTQPDGGMVLAYAVSVTPSISEGWTYFIDAANGSVLHRLSRIQTELTPLPEGWT